MTSNGITDEASDPFTCGVVEGFYGRPWTAEQRKDLFEKMNNVGMNTYMYAPKDDFKHRIHWRELYSVEEAEQLRNLIMSCKENGVEFYYALSPGLDITYSNPKEVSSLKRKLEQVQQCGCEAFALLFDDIEPEISATDKEVFKSFGHAQVSVTNDVYQSLGHPKFVFCPTEYCSARAVPNVQGSDYLNTIGNKLLKKIDIMWTGCKVISKNINIRSIQELGEVLKRRPLLWDNLHANDYDTLRLFCGPYSGRSTDLLHHLKGILTNPNCEYEPNFIPIHTLSQWSRCRCDASSVSAEIKLETESENGSLEDIPTHLSPLAYHPRKALKAAIEAWLPEFNRPKNAFGKCTSSLSMNSATSDLPSTTHKHLEETAAKGLLLINRNSDEVCTKNSDSKETEDSLATQPSIHLEPMDCNQIPSSSTPTVDAQMDETTRTKPDIHHPDNIIAAISNKAPKTTDPEEMQTESCAPFDDESRNNTLTIEDISLLVDMFYLPFEHGYLGLQFLSEFQWLKTNGSLITENTKKRESQEVKESPEVTEWYEKAEKFNTLAESVGRLLTRLTYCKNRSLLYDVYPYVRDIKGVICLLNSYVKWVGMGSLPTSAPMYMQPTFTWFSKGYKEAFINGEQEPWVFRGGLTGELQRLLPVESITEVPSKQPEPSGESTKI